METLKKLPDPVYFNLEDKESFFKDADLDNIYDLLDQAKNGKSFVKDIHNKREFKNPEYLQV